MGAIDSLTVKHLQDDCQTRRPDFAKLPTKPRKLHLLITTWSDDSSWDMDIHIRHRHALFNMQLNATWLKPLQSKLTHLTLHCDTYWGIYPRWQPDNLKFPHLTSLAFGKWTIAHDWQIDFITSHGATLEQLIFTRCPIMHAARLTRRQEHNLWQERLPGTSRGGPPTTNHFSDLRWHTVLPRLVSGLPKLTHFSMGRGLDDDIPVPGRPDPASMVSGLLARRGSSIAIAKPLLLTGLATSSLKGKGDPLNGKMLILNVVDTMRLPGDGDILSLVRKTRNGRREYSSLTVCRRTKML
jgi:hypothetical protein